MLFEGVKELVEHVLFGLLATSNIWVHGSVVGALEVLNVDSAVSIAIKTLECKIHQRLAAVIHLTNNLTKELIIVNRARVVTIEQSEDSADLWGLSREDTVVLHGLTKLSK